MLTGTLLFGEEYPTFLWELVKVSRGVKILRDLRWSWLERLKKLEFFFFSFFSTLVCFVFVLCFFVFSHLCCWFFFLLLVTRGTTHNVKSIEQTRTRNTYYGTCSKLRKTPTEKRF